MRLLVVPFSAVALAATAALSEPVFAQGPSDDFRRSIGNLRPSASPSPGLRGGSPPGLGAGHGRRDGPARPGGNQGRHPYRGWGHSPRYLPSPGYGLGWYRPYPYYPSYLPYDYWSPYPPPLYMPSELLYGPEAVKRFMGLDRIRAPAADPQIIALPLDAEEDPAGKPVVRRASNQRSINLGWRFIGFGDAHFGNQKYADAYQRYKDAAQAAPTLADAYFRQGYALVALGNYQQAAKVWKRGLELDPGWARSGFRADELYGNNRLAKTAHLGALAQATLDEPKNADLLFLVGVFLHFDAQTERAEPFFQEAARLVRGNDAHLKGFLKPAVQADGK